MIEVNEATNGTVVKQETPKQMTTQMILNDLENGIDRNGIKEKYNLETWMVTEMFKHPKLKGKKAKKKRVLPFEFIDDTETVDPNQTEISMPDGSTIDELDAAEPSNEMKVESFDDEDELDY